MEIEQLSEEHLRRRSFAPQYLLHIEGMFGLSYVSSRDCIEQKRLLFRVSYIKFSSVHQERSNYGSVIIPWIFEANRIEKSGPIIPKTVMILKVWVGAIL
jgi:hypothetical protein